MARAGNGWLAAILVWAATGVTSAATATEGVRFSPGDRVAFLGDSITAQGWTSPAGYVNLVVAGLAANGVGIEPIPAGVGGNRSSDMLARLDRDVIAKRPHWVTVSCGMNDVIQGARGVPIEAYRDHMRTIVERCRQAGIRVILFTTTLAGKADSPQSRTLGDYSEVVRRLAADTGCPLVDLYAASVEQAARTTPLRSMTYDGVHMMPEGNMLIARTVLAAVGCAPRKLARAEEAWLAIPRAGSFSTRVDVELNQKYFVTNTELSLGEREKILAAVEAAGRPTVMHWSKDLLLSLMKQKLRPNGPYESLEALFEPGVREKVQAELQEEFTARIRAIVEAR